MADHFQKQNGVIERFFRRLKEEIVQGRLADHRRSPRCLRRLAARDNAEWLIGKTG